MTIARSEDWLWDSWYCLDGDTYHAFHLTAPKSLVNPDFRHHNSRVGHSFSKDLVTWEALPDALLPAQANRFDNKAIWTGSILKHDGLWHMFYTGIDKRTGGAIQRIGHAVSTDLVRWDRVSTEPILEADSRWYSTMSSGEPDEPFRDPWVFKREDTWHMLVTARSNVGEPRTRGVIGHATSTDMLKWTVQPPLSAPGHDFGQQEVYQYAEVDGVPILLFCCGWRELSAERQKQMGKLDATYSLAITADFKDVDFSKAKPFLHNPVYAGRLIQGTDGRWNLIGFENIVDGEFVGRLSDPIPVTATASDGLILRTN